MTTDILAPVRHLIGTTYEDCVKDQILEATGLSIAVGPNDVATKDLRTDRVMISVDDNGVIRDLSIC